MAHNPQSDPVHRLKGSEEILGFLTDTYGSEGLTPTTVVALALSEAGLVLGQARSREIGSALTPFDMVDVVRSMVAPLVSDSRGARTDAVLLCLFRDGPIEVTEADAAWWSALSRVCWERGIRPADVVCSSANEWSCVQASTRGRVRAA